ncbi:MAG: hypothetical protein KGS72_08065 [Cyanobacteria bacterium REEB67]|nr:hypothetical protein [Cyanobacteria bacterium REEB67]
MSLAILLTTGLQATGLTLLLLAAAHAYLDTLLSWRADLAKLRPINNIAADLRRLSAKF